jgi:DNA-binding phage protein
MIYSKRFNCKLEITMNYQELIAKALHGRSVNATAKTWGMAQPTLDRYMRGERIPDFNTTMKIIEDSGVAAEVVGLP